MDVFNHFFEGSGPGSSSERNIFRVIPESRLVEWDEEATDNGMDPALRKEVVGHLYRAMADSHIIFLKTSRFFWNIKGPSSHNFKKIFKEQAAAQGELMDSLAQRIRALSYKVPYSLLEFLEFSEIRELAPEDSVSQMLRGLAGGHSTITKNMKGAFSIFERSGDRATMDVFVHHISFHESSMRTLLSSIPQEEGPEPTGLLT